MANRQRLRLFAGPNGSGKSTIKKMVIEELGPEQMGIIIDPDDIEKKI
ncbi:MAG: ATP-binding cassette domain-containing protein [Bacteroidia bacterium]|nr:ATP-binding cassette domain-containing protein [Bacteroidia bacterium]